MRLLKLAPVVLLLAACAGPGPREDPDRRAEERRAQQAEENRLCRIHAEEGQPDPRCPPPEQMPRRQPDPLGVPPLPQAPIPH